MPPLCQAQKQKSEQCTSFSQTLCLGFIMTWAHLKLTPCIEEQDLYHSSLFYKDVVINVLGSAQQWLSVVSLTVIQISWVRISAAFWMTVKDATLNHRWVSPKIFITASILLECAISASQQSVFLLSPREREKAETETGHAYTLLGLCVLPHVETGIHGTSTRYKFNAFNLSRFRGCNGAIRNIWQVIIS